jgi:DNA (cytosine-5)-methyltransferase 1
MSGEINAPDMLVGGTPCQAFSVAGKRLGLEDLRGNLTLTFIEVLNAIDSARSVCGLAPAVCCWENVPGVLSSKDNAFGCFLGGLAGFDGPLVSSHGKWGKSGLVIGPRRRVAWCVLDAQYFGVAQRRRRVWVVAVDAETVERDPSKCPSKILSIGACLRGDTPTRREERQKAADSVGGVPEKTSKIFALMAMNSGRDYKAREVEVSQPILTKPHGGNQGGDIALSHGIPGNWIGRSPGNGGNSTRPMEELAPCLTTADQHGVAIYE